QWDEKEKEMKKLQNHFEQETFKYRADFELLNNRYQNELNQLKFENDKLRLNTNKSDIAGTEIEKQIQIRNTEINKLKQDVHLKDTQIADKDKLIQQTQKDVEIIKQDLHKEEQLSIHYKKFINQPKQKNSKLTQKFNDQNETEEKIQSFDTNKFLSTLSTPTHGIHFDTFRSSSKLLKTFTGHTSYVRGIDYSTFDDCQFICSGSHDKTVRVWDVDKSKQIQSFNGHSDSVYCVKFSSYHYHNHHQN
ncbi:WD-repeat protein, partial [Reticulomyxa filosa]